MVKIIIMLFLISFLRIYPDQFECSLLFQVEIFDIREEISESEDNSHLDEIASDVNSRIAILEKELRVCFVEKDWTAAKTLVVKWKYLLKVRNANIVRHKLISI